MIAAGYSMDLYCDVNREHPYDAFYRRLGTAQYNGETWGDCAKQARAKGWRISQDKMKCACPLCVKEGRSY